MNDVPLEPMDQGDLSEQLILAEAKPVSPPGAGRQEQQPVDWRIFALVVAYGVGAWVTINGLFSELPLIVNDLPEGWATASYLTLVIQIANVGPLLYILLEKHVTLFSANLAVLLLGALSMVLLGFFWDTTDHVGGREHSVPLLVLSFTAALADCTTSLLFWPFIGRFPSPYAAALSTGEGLSGLIAAILTWIQSAPDHGLLYSPRVFFFLLALLLLGSLAAFLALHRRVPTTKTYAALPTESEISEPDATSVQTARVQQSQAQLCLSRLQAALPPPRQPPSALSLAGPYLLVVAWVSACQNGIKPSIASYATLPYGARIYQATSNAGLALDPVCALLSLHYPCSPRFMASGTFAMSALLLYVLVMALHSPDPPALGGAGAPFVLLAMIIGGILQSYLKASALRSLQAMHALHGADVAAPKTLAQALSSSDEPRIAARLARGGALPTAAGLAMQIGSLVAAILFFCLVNYTHLFAEK